MSFKPYILFVDDDIFTRDTIRDLLQNEYEIKCVDNGQDCLDSVADRIPDLILLDIYMPVLDGIKTAQLLRLNPKFKKKPIIFFTGLEIDAIESNAHASGANAYLLKPIDINELRATIKQLIDS